MTPAETERLGNVLRAKQAELSGLLRNRDEIIIEKAPDDLDQVQLMGERELAIRNLDRDSDMAPTGSSRPDAHSPGHVRRLPPLRGRYFAKAHGSFALGELLHQVSGTD